MGDVGTGEGGSGGHGAADDGEVDFDDAGVGRVISLWDGKEKGEETYTMMSTKP